MAEAQFARHREHSRRALQKAQILIITLGLTEIWQDREDGSVISLPAGPYVSEGGDMSRYAFRVSRTPENLDNLERIHALMARFNPGCRLLITVSPVNLWATFRRDLDVISASCNSKSTLRAAADEFAARHDNVTYFPAYEMATIYQPLLDRSYFEEGRENFHVNKRTVKFIMNHFFKWYAPSEPMEPISQCWPESMLVIDATQSGNLLRAQASDLTEQETSTDGAGERKTGMSKDLQRCIL